MHTYVKFLEILIQLKPHPAGKYEWNIVNLHYANNVHQRIIRTTNNLEQLIFDV